MRILLESVLLMYFCIVDILPSELTLQDLSLTEGKINLNVHHACQTWLVGREFDMFDVHIYKDNYR